MLNWMDKEVYAYTSSLTPEGWAFEFLRRNTEYQKDYLRLKEAYDQLEQKHGALNESTKEKWQSDLLYWHHEPPLPDDESYSEWFCIAAQLRVDPKRTILHEYISSKWGLLVPPPDPSAPADPPPKFTETGPFPLFPSHEEIEHFFSGDFLELDPDGNPDWGAGAGPYQQNHGFATIVINLNLRLEPQLHLAKKMLKEIQRKQKNAGYISPLNTYTHVEIVELFVRYLRVLDADAAGVKPAQMGPIIFGWKGGTGGTGDAATKSAWESLQAAKKYLEASYLVIPALNFPSV